MDNFHLFPQYLYYCTDVKIHLLTLFLLFKQDKAELYQNHFGTLFRFFISIKKLFTLKLIQLLLMFTLQASCVCHQIRFRHGAGVDGAGVAGSDGLDISLPSASTGTSITSYSYSGSSSSTSSK